MAQDNQLVLTYAIVKYFLNLWTVFVLSNVVELAEL